MLFETDRPRPVPFPGALVVKNGSKIFGKSFGEMPSPLSSISKHTFVLRRFIRNSIFLSGEAFKASFELVAKL